MTLTVNEEVVALPLFNALSEPTRTRLLRATISHSVAAGTVLFEQGTMPNFQIVVMSGSAQLFGQSNDRREVLIDIVRAPDLVVPAAVVSGAPYLMQARVPEPSRFLLIQAEAFRTAVATDPRLAQAVLLGLAEQFRGMVRQIKNLKLRSAIQRVGCYILALSARQCTPYQAVLPYEKHLVASELGMTKETFSRAVSSLKESGIRIEGKKIIIVDHARLAAQSNPDPLIDGSGVRSIAGYQKWATQFKRGQSISRNRQKVLPRSRRK